MDMDCCGDDNFYDEIASLLPPTDGYSLDDIEEILRSTDSHLDSSIDLNNFVPHNVHDFHMSSSESLQQPNAYEGFGFSMPTPCSTTRDTFSESSTPAYVSQRTSSTSSMDEESFNPDDFMNFLNDDVKMDSVTHDTAIDIPRRNTPSPTGSCTSSSGSSTSGIQSDASSVSSSAKPCTDTQPLLAEGESEKADCSNEEFSVEDSSMAQAHVFTAMNAAHVVPTQKLITPATVSSVSTTIPITMPVLPVQTSVTTASSILQALPQVQPAAINMLPGTIIPIKTMPLTSVTPVSCNKAPAPIKIEPKLAPKASTTTTQPMSVKIVAPSATGKITPPPNSKPKTVFLSFNDYKALTQMNGKGGKVANGQGPKIILKTANGKLITANKIVSGGNVVSVPNAGQNFMPKIVKTAAGPIMIKHQPTRLDINSTKATNIAAAKATTTSSMGSSFSASNLSNYKGIIDEKMLKKQQRMIKNRESASLSRKKKKEYVVSLETRISNLEKENYTLRGQNSSLRSQLVALAQSCQCKNSNISEFVLNSLNISTKGNGTEHQHVKIAPKPAGKSIKQRMTAANVRKNVALLFAMAFMVSLNVGNFQTYLSKNSIENSIESTGVGSAAEETHAGGRRLLWVETESEFKEKLNRNKRDTELEVPPLHFLQPINRTKANAEQSHNNTESDSSTGKCAGGANYTDNLRLHSNLHKWIDGNDYLNLSMHGNLKNGLENTMRLKYVPRYFAHNSFDVPIGESGKQKRKYLVPGPLFGSKQRKLDDPDVKKSNSDDYGNGNGNGNGNEHGHEKDQLKNSLEIFKPKINDEYVRLFKGIKRQDDTFYVLSFNMDHILLPASAYNKSARPKMSLMLPAGDPSLNGDIVLMQIDCEVMNTTELELKSYMIPEKLRPQKYSTGSFQPTPNPNDVVNNETRSHERQQRDNITVHQEALKQKSGPRTYFMMGPKSQAATAVLKKKPTIVKFNNSEGIGSITNIKNSTLFARMRETVEADLK